MPKKIHVAIKIMDLEKITTSFEDIRVRITSIPRKTFFCRLG